MLIEMALLGGSTTLWRKVKGQPAPSARPLIHKLTNKPEPVPAPSAGLRLWRDIKSAILGDERQQLQMSLDAERQAKLATRKREENRKLRLASGATALALLGTLSPLFYGVGSVAVIYLGRHLFQSIWQDFKRKHYISVQMVSVTLMLGMIANGQLFLSALAGLTGGLLVKLIRKAEDSSQQQLINVFGGHPRQVWLEAEGVEIQVPFASLKPQDIVVVNAGEVIPVDGIIQSGAASIDQHLLTGESQPVDKTVGDKVFAATLVLAGRIRIQVETAGEETVAANIGHVLNNTQSYKDNLMLRGKKIADTLLPVEMAISAITLGILGPVPALAILWSGLGYRMIMYGPISVLNYLQILARQGILIKDGRVLESVRQIDTVVFDKTGTLTLEQPTIGQIHALNGYTPEQVLYYAASAEYRQPHPVAKAILEKATAQDLTPAIPDDISYQVGYGIKVQLQQTNVYVGSARFMQQEGLSLPDTLETLQQQAEAQGHSLIFVGIDQTVAGVLEMQPSIRPEARSLIQSLQARGLTTYIISGDHEQPTRAIARELGVDHYFAETLPENKAALINQLRAQGKFVCFIGDGINDAIALKSAQVSISLKGASSAATDTAQIIFMDGTLTPLTKLLQLTDEFEQTMRNNLLLSIAPGVLNIGGVYLLHFGIATSMGLFYAGTTTGLANTVYPLLRHQDTKASTVATLSHT